jgi:hypothetical protein
LRRPGQHFWRFYDLATQRTMDNRFLIANLIACSPDTDRVIGDIDVFAIQEQVIDDIVRQAEAQVAVEEAPRILDPIQQTIATVLRSYLNHPEVDRATARDLLRGLASPMPGVHVRRLRTLYTEFTRTKDIGALINGLKELPLAQAQVHESSPTQTVKREDLHLVCFDFIWS